MNGWLEANMNGKESITRELLECCKAAKLQIQYLHEKFTITGTGAQVIARLSLIIARTEGKEAK